VVEVVVVEVVVVVLVVLGKTVFQFVFSHSLKPSFQVKTSPSAKPDTSTSCIPDIYSKVSSNLRILSDIISVQLCVDHLNFSNCVGVNVGISYLVLCRYCPKPLQLKISIR
jgi:hypothetical protein